MSAPTQDSLDTHRPKQRVLACVLCQQRKVKCDRKFPCSNCTKHGMQCVPATQPRQRRRRFAERELLERLRKYEALMRQNNVKFEPLHEHNDTPEKTSPDTQISDHEYAESEGSHARSEGISEVRNIWQAMRQGYRDPNDSFRENVFSNAMDQRYSSDDNMLFGSRQTAVELYTLHPDPAHLFRLWQIYLDNVNPLLKVTHTPTLQGRIVEAASNVKEIPPTLEALMFGIYCMATLSLSSAECESMFKQTKKELLERFQFGCQQALLNSTFLRTSSRDCLTALFLYLHSIRSGSHPKSISSMLAVAMRIAQRMGLQSEAINVKHSVLEAEMRRRLWWSLVLFDARVSALGDHKPTTLAPGWDCALPMNVSDSELREETKEPPRTQEQATEALFAIVRSEIGEYTRHSQYFIAFTNPAMKPLAKSLPECGDAGALEKMIEDKYLRYCDVENRIHYMTLWTARGSIATCRLMTDLLGYLDSSSGYSQAQHQTAVSYAIQWLECDTKLTGSPLTKGFHWFLQLYFPFPAYIRIIQDLKTRPLSSEAERAWKVMNDNYEARFDPESDVHHFVFKPFTNIVLFAWDTVKAAYEQAGRELVTPKLIDNINQKLEQLYLETQDDTGDQSQDFANMSMDDMPMSMPSGFNDPGMFFNMGGQPGYEGNDASAYNGLSAHAPLTVNMSQLNWGSMSWGLGGSSGW
ncbi:hypothetical protein FSARC_4764 [Fusarium sarcochroum]|uniref:Zn(2)-C6 fungal-type domain-containing protein n=1 Tax=Fusarium sarcochroum TaxID=1208366 RepID=A0A8H4U1D0_9HYPO|nr:hypothetical protein FSARC_4764 [Fusarium sarcochroum]